MTVRRTFERPHRPLVVRLYNLIGGFLRKIGVTTGKFTEQSLIDDARRRTGLSDFGDESFRVPMRILLKAYQEQTDLTPFGRLLVRMRCLHQLCNRLRVQDELKNHPEILEAPIRRPLIITGLPRTGTTLLYNLLARDPVSRPLLMWEGMWPAQHPKDKGKEPDPRIKATIRWSWALKKLAPNLTSVHSITPEGPEECSRLLLNTFVTTYFMVKNYVMNYLEWLMNLTSEDLETSYRHYYKQLQVLQWQRPPKGHWVLKSPAHLFCLGTLLRVLPDACVIQTHRDPRKVIPSTCSLLAVCHGIFSNNVRTEQLGPEVAELCAEGLRRGKEARDGAKPGRVFDVHYKMLVEDPVGTIRQIYRHFDYEFTREMEEQALQWLKENPLNKHGKHRYDMEQFGLIPEMIDRLFESYCREYQIEPEDRSVSPAVPRPGTEHERFDCCSSAVTNQN